MTNPNEHVDPIPAGDPHGRLGKIVKRLGGKSRTDMTDPTRMVLPAPKRGLSKDQLTLDDVDE